MANPRRYWRIDPSKFEALRDEPAAAEAFMIAALEQSVDDGAHPWLGLPEAFDNESHLHISEHGQAVHFLLTGEPDGGGPPSLRKAIAGGPSGQDPQAEGIPLEALSVEEVRELAEELGRIPEEDLRAVFDPAAFNAARVGPDPVPGGWGPEDLEPLLREFERLARFFQGAARSGDAVLMVGG